MKVHDEEEERRLKEGTKYFLGLIEEEKARGVDYAPLERAAGLPPSTIGKIKKEVRETYGRKFTAVFRDGFIRAGGRSGLRKA